MELFQSNPLLISLWPLLMKALWKSKSPWRVNITIWIMLFGLLNCSLVLQRKLPSHCLSPNMCAFCKADWEDLQHLFFNCCYAGKCWQRLFACFNISWVFGKDFRDNVLHVLMGPKLKASPKLLWNNAFKALLADLWFERNQMVFHDKETPWFSRFEIVWLNASSWCSFSKAFTN